MRELMGTPLSDEPYGLRGQLVQIEAWNARMTTLLAHAESHLAAAEDRELSALTDPKSATTERRVHVRFMTRQERRVRDTLKGLCRSMEYRMMLGMSLMKAHNVERAARMGT